MTFRSFFFGLTFALLIAAFGYANDWICRLPYVASDLMPISVYGILTLGLLALNPLLRFLRMRRLRGAEWAVICAFALAACAIPGPGLLWYFHNALVMPHKLSQTTPGWQGTKSRPALIDYAPKPLLVNPESDKLRGGDVANAFVQGLADGERNVAPSRIPWRAWLRPYCFYIPLILFGTIASICLMLILHTQWSQHEHLPYPMARFASALIGNDPEHPFSQLARNRPFWLGFGVSFGILLLNGLHAWFPEFPFHIPQQVDLSPLADLLGWIKRVPRGTSALLPRFYFVVIGLAFLVNAEVSFSIGISMLAYALFFGFLAGFGVVVNREVIGTGSINYQHFGAYLGGFLFMLYTGRHFYWRVLKSAFGASPPPEECSPAAWYCRAALFAMAAMIALIRFATGVDWLFSTCLVLLFGILFVNIARINAETGALTAQPYWQPIAVLLALFGAQSLGPVPLLVGGMLCIAFTLDPRVCLMPLIANGLKFGEDQKLRLPRLGMGLILCFGLCVVIGLPTTLYLQHTTGSASLYGWANSVPGISFNLLGEKLNQLEAIGKLADAGSNVGFLGLERLTCMSVDSTFLCFAGLGLILVVLCHGARLRWSWWPIHPVMFMVWGTIVSAWFAGSFLLGWIIKWAVVRFGNRQVYNKATRFFIGLIAGEMIAGIFWMLIGGAYYLLVRIPPPMFRVHP